MCYDTGSLRLAPSCSLSKVYVLGVLGGVSLTVGYALQILFFGKYDQKKNQNILETPRKAINQYTCNMMMLDNYSRGCATPPVS